MKDFHNTLNQTDITKEDYEHAQKVWNTFNIKNLGEYHDLYVQSDTLLLADIFENFRETCQRIYKLDPTHFLSAPDLAWQACLKMTKVKLELLTDENMLLMVEEGIRGRVCQAIHHYETANNKYMKNYNKNVISSYLQYLDANNLYGWAMSKKLPVREFTWAKKPSIYTEKAIKMHDENNGFGVILEVDIEYPTMACIKHNDLPFIPQRKGINKDLPQRKEINKDLPQGKEINKGSPLLPQRKKINKIHKLVTTVEDKEKYVIHISALKQALDHGLKLKKVHTVIEFKQEAWLKPYIDMNTDLRKDAKNDFEKDFFKLMNNSVFGKTMENVRNHRDMKLVTTNAQRRKYVSEPNYMTSKCFSKDLMAIEMRKTEVLMNKPVCLGQAILDISKTLMYEFYYEYLNPKYGDKLKLCYMDTDSFIIHVQTEDFYKDIADDVSKWFDTSDYDKKLNRPLPIGINKKVIGMFKDELNGMCMTEFCAPRAKTYAFRHYDDEENKRKEKKKTKGTKKCVIKNDLKFDDCKMSTLKNETITRSQQRFKSDHHNVFTEEINKVAISSNDDKRIQDFDRFTTHAYGTPAVKICESKMLAKKKVKPIAMYY